MTTGPGSLPKNSGTARGYLRFIAPILLASLGAMLLIGCIPFTFKEKVVDGTDYRPVLGTNGQWLVNGRTTRDQLVERLGKPQYQYDVEGGRFAAYYLRTNTGFWVVPLCFTTPPQEQYRLLQLEFNSAGILVQHEVAEEDEKPAYLNWQPGAEKMSLEQGFQRWIWESMRNWPDPQRK